MTTMTKVRVTTAYPEDGPLYLLRNTEFPGQDTSDTFVVAEDAKGTRYRHKKFVVKGSYVTEADGFTAPTPRHYCDEEAGKFIAKVLARGEIDLAHWETLVEREGPPPVYFDEDEEAAGWGRGRLY